MKNNAHLTALRAALETEAISEDARDLILFAIDDYDIYETPRDLCKALESGEIAHACYGFYPGYTTEKEVQRWSKIAEEASLFVETFGY